MKLSPAGHAPIRSAIGDITAVLMGEPAYAPPASSPRHLTVAEQHTARLHERRRWHRACELAFIQLHGYIPTMDELAHELVAEWSRQPS